MKKTSKAILLVLCAVLLVVGSVMGTMAYLTYKTNTVQNTFTVGNVNLGGTTTGANGETIVQEGLDEAKVDEYGVPDSSGARVLSNEYKLIPGHTYTKDPTIHVGAESEACWLFVSVSNGIEAIEGGNTIAAQMEANGWKQLAGDVYYYTDKVETTTVGKDIVVFSEFTIKEDVTIDQLQAYKDAKVTVIAYAVQAEGFADAQAAWAATSSQFTTP